MGRVNWEQARNGQKVWSAKSVFSPHTSRDWNQMSGGEPLQWMTACFALWWSPSPLPQGWLSSLCSRSWTAVVPLTCSVRQFWTCFISYSVIFATRVASEESGGEESGGAEDWKQYLPQLSDLNLLRSENVGVEWEMSKVKLWIRLWKGNYTDGRRFQLDKYTRKRGEMWSLCSENGVEIRPVYIWSKNELKTLCLHFQ